MGILIVRLAEESDKYRVLELLNDVFNKQQRSASSIRGEEFWNWKYKKNIFGKAIIHVIEDETDMLAIGTMWPWEFKTRASALKAFQLCDTVVSEKARGKGLFSMLNFARIEYAKEKGADFIYNFPNMNSLPGYLKMGWSFLGNLQWHIKVLKPLNFFYYILDKSQAAKINIPEHFKITNQNLDFLLKNTFSSNIEVNKKKGYYEWRYKMHPSREYGIISVKNSRKFAFSIFTLSKKNNAIEMIIVDNSGDSTLNRLLLKKIIKTAKELRVTVIFTLEGDFGNNNLKFHGFFTKKNKNLVCFPLNMSIEQKITNINNWNLFAGMHDSI